MSLAKVITLPASNNFKPEQALHSALAMNPTDVLVLAVDRTGQLVIRSSHMTRADALFLVEKARDWVMNGGHD